MIRVEGLTRRYGDFLAVDNVSFEIGQGEIVGLLGHNGAGKTTLMKMLAGYLEPDAGVIRVDELAMETSRRAVQQKIGYLPENCPVYSEMTVIDFLRYTAQLHGLASSLIDKAVYQAIDRTALHEKAMDLIATLSRGLRQRVGVAQAILHEPQILILDEPTNGLDPTQIHHMRDLIKTLSTQATIIVSTHILQEVQAVCDRAIIMRRGCKVVDARLTDLRQINQLIVEVNAPMNIFTSLLAKLTEGDEIAKVSLLYEQQGHYRYALLLRHTSVETLSPRLARAVHEHGFQLSVLYPEMRDLETVFSEINTEEPKEA